MNIGFDIISDLYLLPDDSFNWENKATSLYCLVAGNISSNTRTTINILTHLSKFYQGVFFIPGALEYQDAADINNKTKEIINYSKKITNLAVLYQNVVIIDGVAVLGANGWYGNKEPNDGLDEVLIEEKRHEDIAYLKHSLDKLQKHLDVKKIVILTNSIPNKCLYFGEDPKYIEEYLPLDSILFADTEHKISHWVFGAHNKIVDTKINGINYINNPKFNTTPYWAKRIEV